MGCYLEKSRVILMTWPRFCTIIYGLRKENLNFIKLEYKPQNEVRAVDFSELREKMLIGG